MLPPTPEVSPAKKFSIPRNDNQLFNATVSPNIGQRCYDTASETIADNDLVYDVNDQQFTNSTTSLGMQMENENISYQIPTLCARQPSGHNSEEDFSAFDGNNCTSFGNSFIKNCNKFSLDSNDPISNNLDGPQIENDFCAGEQTKPSYPDTEPICITKVASNSDVKFSIDRQVDINEMENDLDDAPKTCYEPNANYCSNDPLENDDFGDFAAFENSSSGMDRDSSAKCGTSDVQNIKILTDKDRTQTDLSIENDISSRNNSVGSIKGSLTNLPLNTKAIFSESASNDLVVTQDSNNFENEFGDFNDAFREPMNDSFNDTVQCAPQQDINIIGDSFVSAKHEIDSSVIHKVEPEIEAENYLSEEVLLENYLSEPTKPMVFRKISIPDNSLNNTIPEPPPSDFDGFSFEANFDNLDPTDDVVISCSLPTITGQDASPEDEAPYKDLEISDTDAVDIVCQSSESEILGSTDEPGEDFGKLASSMNPLQESFSDFETAKVDDSFNDFAAANSDDENFSDDDFGEFGDWNDVPAVIEENYDDADDKNDSLLLKVSNYSFICCK